ISRVIYSQIAIVINTYYTGKLFGLGYLDQVKDFSKYLILSVLCCAPAFAMTYLGLNNLLMLIIGATVSCALYCFVLRSDSKFIELLDIITEKLPFLKVWVDKLVVRQ
ncbi:MAG: lipopolysaccharide biosynthesis protein, partial [Bacteroidales bacterium]|nr:lipopolysaccharide biosynthesis protein [Bacteroidales bacterium]